MATNQYLLRDLPLLPDHMLLMIYGPYRDACALFDEARDLNASIVAPQLRALRETTARIEEELRARGIGAEPWWVDQKTRKPAVNAKHWKMDEVLV